MVMGKGKGKGHLTMKNKQSSLSIRISKIFNQYSWSSKKKEKTYWISFTVHFFYVETEKNICI